MEIIEGENIYQTKHHINTNDKLSLFNFIR